MIKPDIFFKWPKKKFNFYRFVRFYKHKINRIRDMPEAISIGLAWGAAVSFTPLLGLHIIICFLGTFVMRGNILAAAAGTIIGNPWTFPFIFYFDYKIGEFIYNDNIEEFNLRISFLIENFEELFVPTLIGSIPVSIIVWIITYKTSKKIFVRKKYGTQKN